MTISPQEQPISDRLTLAQQRARDLRPRYFERCDSLVASGAFAVEDRRQTHRPTGRRYAD